MDSAVSFYTKDASAVWFHSIFSLSCIDFLCPFISGAEAYMGDLARGDHKFGEVGKWRRCVCAVKRNLLAQYAPLLPFGRSVAAISGALE